MMVSEDKILCLSFAARLAETTGTIAMVSCVVATPCFAALRTRKLFRAPTFARVARRVRERFARQPIHRRSEPAGQSAYIRQLISLEPGKVLMVPNRTSDPIHLNIAGQPVFLAYPCVRDAAGARIEKRVSLAAHPANKRD